MYITHPHFLVKNRHKIMQYYTVMFLNYIMLRVNGSKYADMFNKVAEETGDPDLLGLIPGAIVEPYLLYFEEEEEKAKVKKKGNKPKQ